MFLLFGSEGKFEPTEELARGIVFAAQKESIGNFGSIALVHFEVIETFTLTVISEGQIDIEVSCELFLIAWMQST